MAIKATFIFDPLDPLQGVLEQLQRSRALVAAYSVQGRSGKPELTLCFPNRGAFNGFVNIGHLEPLEVEEIGS